MNKWPSIFSVQGKLASINYKDARKSNGYLVVKKGKYNFDGTSDKKLILNCLEIDHSTPSTKLPSLKYTPRDTVDGRPRGEISAVSSSDWLGRNTYGPVCTWTGSLPSDGLGGLNESVMHEGSGVMNGWIYEKVTPSSEHSAQTAGQIAMSSGGWIQCYPDFHLPKE